MARRVVSDVRGGQTAGHPVFHPGRAGLLPQGGAPQLPQISAFVTVSWAWTDQAHGNISWTFVNADPSNSHAVVLYRNNYIFGGAFWPVYLGPDDTVSHMLDGTQPIPTLTGTGGQPMGILDYGPGASPRYLVHFIFNLAPGQTWSTPEGGFTGGITPTAGACYEMTSSVAGNYCVGYDPQRVTDWDNQTDTSNRGYAPNPSTYFTYAFTPEAATPENTLGYKDAIGSGTCVAPSLAFRLEKSTFSEDEVAVHSSFPSACLMQVEGFTNAALGFTSASSLNASPPNPVPVVSASILPSLNTGLSAGQIAAIAANLPTVNTYGPPPVLSIDPSLDTDYQTFLYPFTISFPTENAFATLSLHQAAIITLSATFTVGSVTVTAQANIELSKGEDPFFTDLTPSNPLEYPSWLSFDLRFFKVTPNQAHQMFSVPNPTDAGGAIPYIQTVLHNLNNPNLITNGDTFDTTLSQDEDASALEFLPTDTNGNPTFNFAVARVRIIAATATTTTTPVRVFFRLFQAASTVSDFHEVGTGQGTYRWGTDGSPNHKIPLLGVQTDQNGNLEYVTVPCFATERVNLNGPADMNTQHDDPNAVFITTVADEEVDTYFGCWLDINQSGTNFLIPTPPGNQAQWDGPWTGTESLNGAIIVAPHQCLIAEIRYDDTPIPDAANSATTDKLAQRNIAWIDGPNPGVAGSRVMPHPFEIRASASVSAPDELLINWGNTPAKNTALLYLPSVQASDIIALANSMYPRHLLTAIDAHTIQCPAAGVTLVPVPAGRGRYAGILSVNLPLGIKRGDIYDISVQQFETAFAQQTQPPPSPRIARQARGRAVSDQPILVPTSFSWRQLMGAFQYTLVISTKDKLLYPEERLLAWLKWRLNITPLTSRWHPVLQRYLGMINGRVSGFGGKPGGILPSPTGSVPGRGPSHPGHPIGHPAHRPGQREITGKVVGIRVRSVWRFRGLHASLARRPRTLVPRPGKRGREPDQARVGRANPHQRVRRAARRILAGGDRSAPVAVTRRATLLVSEEGKLSDTVWPSYRARPRFYHHREGPFRLHPSDFGRPERGRRTRSWAGHSEAR